MAIFSTGWPVAANCLGIERLPVVAGSPTRPVPGWDLRVLGPGGEEDLEEPLLLVDPEDVGVEDMDTLDTEGTETQ